MFRRALDECAALLGGELGRPLLDVLWGGATEMLEQTAYTQPALFAIEYALAGLWKSWGIEPSMVLGHSVGEYVAACVAGVYSLNDGISLIAARGRLMQSISGRGAMAAVFAREEDTRHALRGLEANVSLAAINAPQSVVISGYEPELTVVVERLQAAGLRVQRLSVSHAFHSPQMRGMVSKFEDVVRRVRFATPGVGLISSVTGRAIGREEMGEPEYWSRQVTQPVQFHEAMKTLQAQGYKLFVEIGPGTTLAGLGSQCFGREEALWIASIKHGRGEWEHILESLERLYVRGADVDWAGFDRPYQRRRVALPTYPFERQRCWIENVARPLDAPPASNSGVHPLLGTRFEIAGDPGTSIWQNHIRLGQLPHFENSGAAASQALPLSGLLEMMASAVAECGQFADLFRDITISEPLVFDSDGQKEVQLIVREDALEIHSKNDGCWTRHLMARRGAPVHVESRETAATIAQRLEAQPGANANGGEIVVKVHPSVGVHAWGFEDCFRAVAAALPEGSEWDYLPFDVERIDFYRPAGQPIWVHAARRSAETGTGNHQRFDLQIFDDDGVVARAWGLDMHRAQKHLEPERLELRWEPKINASGSVGLAGNWLVVADRNGTGALLARELEALGGRCTLIVEQSALRAAVSSDAWRGVVYLRALDADPLFPVAAQPLVCGGALELVQALAAQTCETPPRLWLVTRGAQAACPNQGQVAVAQSTLWGMAQAIAEEYPEWRTVCVDLDPDGKNDAADLIGEICASDGEEQTAYRGGQRLVARIISKPFGEALDQPIRLSRNKAAISADATYLVTGAFGFMGSCVVEWLVTQGARNLALVSRSPSHQSTPLLESAAARGARIVTYAADISRREDLARVLSDISASLPPLRGVVHAAGVLGDGVLLHQNWGCFAEVLAPKVGGAWNLHELTASLPLDFFVLCSSVASILGAPGQGNYAAANGFEDALAHERRRIGLPAVSINWGAWAGGMAGRDGLAQRREETGLVPLTRKQGLALLTQIALDSPAQIGAGIFDWVRFLRRYPVAAMPKRFSRLAGGSSRAAAGRGSFTDGAFAHHTAGRPRWAA